jgi:hypothetical protein
MECDHCKRDTNQVHMSQCFTFIPRYLLTSGYTSKRRWMVTGIPARASLKVFGSVSQGVFGVRCMRAGFHGNRLPIRVCNIVSPSSASTSFDPLYAAMPSVISHSPTQGTHIGSTTREWPHCVSNFDLHVCARYYLSKRTHRMVSCSKISRRATH